MIEVDQVLSQGAALRLEGTNVRRGEGETHVYFEPCEESRIVTLSEDCDDDRAMGRAIDVDMTLRSVCPGRRVAVGMELSEVDGDGRERCCGFRAVTVPAHDRSRPCDMAVERVRFILPESARADDDRGGMCGCRRHFVLRTTNHYVDSAAMR